MDKSKPDLTLHVPTPPDFNFRSTVHSHGWCQLAPFALEGDGEELVRLHRLSDDAVLPLTFSAGEGDQLVVTVNNREANALNPNQRRELQVDVRRMFQLELDLSEFYAAARKLDRYRWVEPAGAGRLLRSPTVWEDLAKTLLTTNTNWGATRNMVRRLTAVSKSWQEDGHSFPTAAEVAALSFQTLGEQVRAGYRSQYLHELAVGVASGDLQVESWQDPAIDSADLFERLRSIKGFGAYAAGTMMKLLGHFDQLALDSATRSTYTRVYNRGQPAEDGEIREHYQQYGRWQGLFLWMDLLAEYSDQAGEAGPTHEQGG